MMDICTIIAITIAGLCCGLCTCLYCAQNNHFHNCCNRNYFCLFPPSQVSNMTNDVNVIIVQPVLPEYSEEIPYDEAMFKYEGRFKDELPPPEYIP